MKESRITNAIGPNETILWQGGPDKKCFILESIFNQMLPFSILWCAIDMFVLVCVMNSMTPDPEADEPPPDVTQFLPILLFIFFHMMPVWLYLGGIISSIIKHKSVEYAFTNSAIYIVEGGLTVSLRRLEYTNIEYIDYKRGVFDTILGVGDIVFHRYSKYSYPSNSRNNMNPFMFKDIHDFEYVYRRVTTMLQKNKMPESFDNGSNRY